MSKKERRILIAGCVIGLAGLLQFLACTTYLMQIYPGGNIVDRGSEGYRFLYNFLSDLGRTTNFRRGHNPTAMPYLISLSVAGLSTIVFFLSLCRFLWRSSRHPLIILCLLCGIGAGIGYIGIALHPINVDYRDHRWFVQFSFIAFWLMTVFCAIAIYGNRYFNNAFGHMLLVFAAILGLQIAIMLTGPRSWSSPGALLLQVIAQKVVVYSEIVAMLILNVGTIRAVLRYR